MAFQFLAALAGVSAGAADSIEARNKELQRNAEEEIGIAMKAAEKQRATMQTRRSELKETADLLSTYSQGKLTKTQIAGLLQTPAAAKEVANKLKSARSVEDIDFDSIYKLTKPSTPEQEETAITSTIDRMTRAPKPTEQEAIPSPRGAFGLPTRAYSQTIAEGERAAGMSLAEMKATARGVPELSEEDRIQGKLDLSQFSDPESITNIQGKLRNNMTKGIKLTDPKNATLLKQLKNNDVIKDMFYKEKGDADKPRSAEQIRKITNDAVAVAVNPWVIKGVVRRVPETGEYAVIGGSNEDVDAFQKQKTDVIRRNMVALGLLDKDNNITGGRSAFDVLLPIANIKDNKVVSWKKPSEEAKTPTENITPATSAPRAASVNQTQSVVMLPPKDQQQKSKPAPAGVDPKLWNVMTEEQKQLWK